MPRYFYDPYDERIPLTRELVKKIHNKNTFIDFLWREDVTTDIQSAIKELHGYLNALWQTDFKLAAGNEAKNEEKINPELSRVSSKFINFKNTIVVRDDDLEAYLREFSKGLYKTELDGFIPFFTKQRDEWVREVLKDTQELTLTGLMRNVKSMAREQALSKEQESGIKLQNNYLSEKLGKPVFKKTDNRETAREPEKPAAGKLTDFELESKKLSFRNLAATKRA